MPRYVDVDAFREAALKGMRYQHDKQLLINHSYTFPTAEVRVDLHAHWVAAGECRRVCSHCGHAAEDSVLEYYADGMTWLLRTPYFCGNCGAKMDEDEQK